MRFQRQVERGFVSPSFAELLRAEGELLVIAQYLRLWSPSVNERVLKAMRAVDELRSSGVAATDWQLRVIGAPLGESLRELDAPLQRLISVNDWFFDPSRKIPISLPGGGRHRVD